MRGDFKAANKEFQRAIGLAPQSSFSVDAAHYMADAYLALGDAKNAIKAYQTALRLNPNREGLNEAITRLERQVDGETL